MSDNKEVTIMPYADFTMKDLEAIEKFKEDGMLGLHTLTDVDVERSMALYVDGKTYRQISYLLKINKSVILFLAHKFKWFELRKEYLDELHATLKEKVIESKLQSQEFLLHLALMYQKKIGKNVDRYLRTDDEKHADLIDNRDLATYFKCTELLHKLNSDNLANGDKSLVALNGMGDGVTITKTGANSVEITPKSQFGSKLKQMAELKREAERTNKPVSKEVHDISQEEILTTKESENKNE